MSFIESLIFPEIFSYGASGGPNWFTQVVVSPGGHEQRNEGWTFARAEYELGLQNRSLAETATLRQIAYVTRGQARAFRFLDTITDDFTATDEVVGLGTGALATYSLTKLYTAGDTYTRRIYKPISPTLVVKSNAVIVAPASIDYTQGTFTLSATLGEVVTASFQFHVPVRLHTDLAQFQRVAPNAVSWPSVALIETRDYV